MATAGATTEVSEVNTVSLVGAQLRVSWSMINNDLGKYHNIFIEEFPNCLFVRVEECGPQCTLKKIGPGGLGLIRERTMLKNGHRKLDAEGKVTIDRDAHFIILEKDVIAFGKFGDL